MNFNELNLYDFNFDCGRMGNVFGSFFATQTEVDNLIGTEIYFGEVLGKHSEIYGEMESEHFDILVSGSEYPEVIKVLFNKVGCTISGYNPFEFLDEE